MSEQSKSKSVLYQSPDASEVAAFRSRHGMTQVKAAHAARVSRRTWQAWESGESNMPLSTWELLLIRAGELDSHMSPTP